MCLKGDLEDYTRASFEIVNCMYENTGRSKEKWKSLDEYSPETTALLLEILPHMTIVCSQNFTSSHKPLVAETSTIKDFLYVIAGQFEHVIAYKALVAIMDKHSRYFHAALFLVIWILTSFVEFESARLNALISITILFFFPNLTRAAPIVLMGTDSQY